MYFLVYIDFNEAKNNLKLTNTWEQWKAKNLFISFREKNILNNNLISYSVSNRDGFINQREYFDDGGKAVYASKKNSLIIDFNTFAYNPSRINVGSLCLYKNKEKGLVSPIYEVFKLRNDQNPDFFYLWFKTGIFKKIIANNSNKSVRDTLNLKQFEDQLIITPILSEQNTISSLFSVLDSLITLHQWECNFWKFRNFVFDFLKFSTRFLKKIQKYTHTWEQEKLGNIVDRIIDKNSNLESSRVLTISQHHGLIDQDIFFNHRVASKNLNNYLFIKNDDFAYNRSISGEKIFGVIRRLKNYKNGVISPVYIAFRIKNKNIMNSIFLEYYYLTDLWHKEAKNIVFKGARQLLNVSINDFFDMNLKMPSSHDEQHKIGKLLSNLDSLITLHQRGYKWRENKWKKTIYCYTNIFKIE
ncbi:restriction endonuclease subunit S [Mycoplasma capricolum]|uniref:restriction endonuclease subunit S n=1 Tax=Mycoplasma capricolum TaxID=2095 RepID=UPI003DA2DC1D